MVGSKQGDTSKNLIYEKLRRSIIVGHREPGERLDLDALTKS